MIHAEKKRKHTKPTTPKKNGFAGLNRGEFFGQEQHLRPSEANEKAG